MNVEYGRCPTREEMAEEIALLIEREAAGKCDLTDEEIRLLSLDAYDANEEDGTDFPTWVSYIGGAKNFPSYVACLKVRKS